MKENQDETIITSLSNKKPSKNHHLRFIWDWIIQIFLWIALTVLIITLITIKSIEIEKGNINSDKKGIVITLTVSLFGVIYIIYCINNFFFSNTFKLLFSKKKNKKLERELSNTIKKKPELKFFVECYHFENQVNVDTYSENEIRRETMEEFVASKKVKTYEEIIEYSYLSCRDVSGPFDLSNKIANGKNKYLLDLTLNFEIYFADQITAYMYDKIKKQLIKDNSWRDAHINVFEQKKIENFYPHKILKINDELPFFLKWYTFLVCTIFSFSEVYKLILKMYTFEDHFTIKKLISISNTLEDDKYIEDNPKLILNGQTSEFKYLFKNENYQEIQISPEDIENSKAINEKILDYQNPIYKKIYEELTDSLCSDLSSSRKNSMNFSDGANEFK